MENDKREELELACIILASGSPRRSEILNSVGWKFEKMISEVDESELPGELPVDYVTRLAVAKAKAVAASAPERTVLGADTTVVIDGEILGKPLNLEDARRMIRTLSGRWHEVLTGIALVNGNEVVSGVQSTRVKFVEMDEKEIDFLVRYGDPLDKAGGYAVQAQAALFIERIEGDYWNVVGLPVSLVYSLFTKLSGV